MYNSPGRFVSITGRDIPQDLYSKILDFDQEIFSADADEYEGDTTMPRDTLMSFLQKNILTTSIVYDKQEGGRIFPSFCARRKLFGKIYSR